MAERRKEKRGRERGWLKGGRRRMERKRRWLKGKMKILEKKEEG